MIDVTVDVGGKDKSFFFPAQLRPSVSDLKFQFPVRESEFP